MRSRTDTNIPIATTAVAAMAAAIRALQAAQENMTNLTKQDAQAKPKFSSEYSKNQQK